MKPIDQWGPRTCPRCGMPPMVYCKTASGAVAGLPHRERWPEGPLRTKTAEQRTPEMRLRDRERDRERKRRQRERERERAVEAELALAMQRRRRSEIRRMPKDAALKARAQDVMAAFRERAA